MGFLAILGKFPEKVNILEGPPARDEEIREPARRCGRGQEVVLFGSGLVDNSSWEHLAPKLVRR